MNTSGPGSTYPHGTEVTFRCIASIMGERSTWKILCERGNWIGKSISCGNSSISLFLSIYLYFLLIHFRLYDSDEEETATSGLLGNSSCTFRNSEPNVVSFYNDLEIKEEVVEFPPGAILISRYLIHFSFYFYCFRLIFNISRCFLGVLISVNMP